MLKHALNNLALQLLDVVKCTNYVNEIYNNILGKIFILTKQETLTQRIRSFRKINSN